jgi:superoxide dismutase, Cu-Zn family
MQRRIYFAGAGLLGLGVVAAAVSAVTGATPGPDAVTAQAVIEDARRAAVGTFLAEPDGAGGTRITVSVEGVPAGYHGLHVHNRGVCDPTAYDPVARGPFATAGDHLNLPSRPHPGHSGDLPPLLVNADGTGKMSFMTDRFLIDDLRDGDCSSIIIHAKPDNFANIPDRYTRDGRGGPDSATLRSGDAGDRIACGVIR